MKGKNVAQAISFYIFVWAVLMLAILAASVIPTMTSWVVYVAYPVYFVIIIATCIAYKRESMKFKWGDNFYLGFAVGFIIITLIFMVNTFTNAMMFIRLADNALAAVALAFALEVLVAFGEEMSFRAYILPKLTTGLNVLSGIIISSVFFSVIHIPSILSYGMDRLNMIIMLTTLTLAGVLFAVFYLKYGLLSCISIHFVWNFFQYHIYSLQAGFFDVGMALFEIKYSTSDVVRLITGGEYGPEAGLLGILAITAAILIVMALDRDRNMDLEVYE